MFLERLNTEEEIIQEIFLEAMLLRKALLCSIIIRATALIGRTV